MLILPDFTVIAKAGRESKTLHGGVSQQLRASPGGLGNATCPVPNVLDWARDGCVSGNSVPPVSF